MLRPTRLLPLISILFVVAVVALSRSLEHVRAIDAVRLTGSGFSFGVGFTLLLFAILGRPQARS